LPLEPQEEVRLLAVAQAKCVSPSDLVREALNPILDDLPESPKSEPRPIWDVTLENLKDVSPGEFAELSNDGAAEHDHYLYGSPKRER
jgi:hypothetical protein